MASIADLTPRPESTNETPSDRSDAGLLLLGRTIKIIGEFLDAYAPHTEADPWALLMDLLTWFGNAIGPGPYFLADGAKHEPRLFTVIVGRTSKARKGTSRAHNANLSELVDENWFRRCVAGGIASGEGIARALLGSENEPTDLRLLLIETEFSRVLQAGGRDGSTISEFLRQAWDGGRVQILRSKDPLRIDDSHISLIGHVTFDELRERAPKREISNGLFNRILWIFSERPRILPDGGNIEENARKVLAKDLAARIYCARKLRRMYRTEAGQAAWRNAYHELAERDHPGMLGAVCARSEAQVLRLSLVLALLDGRDAIDAKHVEDALAIWNQCERTATTIWGEQTGNRTANVILDELRRVTPAGLATTDLHNLFSRHKSRDELAAARQVLIDSGLAHTEATKGAGRDAVVLYANDAKNASDPEPSSLSSPTSQNGGPS